jgi:hypothetical protein
MADWIKLLLLAFQIGFAIFQYFTSKSQAREAAAKAMAALFEQTEKMGYPVIKDVLLRTGRSTWIPWNEIPVTPIEEDNTNG